MSYIDIVVIGSVVPARFISKSDVRNWPIIGWLSGMFGTIFVDRKPSSTRASVANICNAVNNRDNVVLFPEGTTSDGCRILPFKSSFFKLPRECVIQPIFLEYKEFNGFPAKRADKKNYSWIGAETAMLPHLIRIMETRRVKACVRILPVISQTESCCDRKALADLSHKSLLSASRGVHI
ncbi:hypothetical protein HYD_5580 [Candidatus Hydrogenosomobacter endosymbioticus]|uniref:Phospholipid/glycerol acyltransferase domain-containing protein n=2 Tax=Candidatus Hydrogenosomobacter endosymbioticus TaxID=2558174 RepID=A0ABM7V9F1_9PROT|nr:hypothetical protein HYD_5580 [Candidatus Hydrogenosomobacter endosymbioticus]